MIKYRILCTAIIVILIPGALTAQAPPTGAQAMPKLETDQEKTLYALGLILGRNIETFALTPEELAFVKAGITDVVAGVKDRVDLEVFGPKVNDLAEKRAAVHIEELKKRGEAFAVEVAKQPGATRTPSGLVIRVIVAGTGASPEATDVVKVHYEGKLIDGTVFDSSIERKEPIEFPLRGVVPCWTEALQRMKVGEKSQIVCPSSLAYGERGAPPDIPPGATLSFEVQLLEFHKP